ncbi:MAG: thiamine-phosphate kinase [Lewinellaceae bacterium]|nr:thiamine-phosphate kinase [Lewinellaceae bacterium]HPR00641.1 thiamine-phosphate kinase [Saprospiraceae bacterium]
MSDPNQNPQTDVNQLGEFGLIDHLTQPFALTQPSSLRGVGDDAAVIDNQGFLTVLSTDMLVEEIHFDRIYHPLRYLGYKAVIVNVSDICAMNAIPKQITVSIALSNRYGVEDLDELYAGIALACEHYRIDLVGGDTTSSNRGLIISITAVGQGEPDRITYRSGAKPGDLLCVSGDLGAAYVGLQLLEREKQVFISTPNVQPDFEGQDYIIGRQLKPEARLDVVELFHKSNLKPTAMIDISDGLASEIFHICKQSGTGAFIEEAKVPINQQTELMAIKFGLDPITCALSGGEDYELLFTIDPADLEKARYLPDLFIIGEITPAADGIKLHTSGGNIYPLQAQGWKHF